MDDQLVNHPLVRGNGGILRVAHQEIDEGDDLSRCICRLFESFRELTRSGNPYAPFIDLYVLKGGGFNAFVIPLAGRCSVFLTMGLIDAVLQATWVSVPRSNLPISRCAGRRLNSNRNRFPSRSTETLRALGFKEFSIEDSNSERSDLVLPIAQAILDFILHHEYMHISMGHVAYNWKYGSESHFLEFGNRDLTADQRGVRTSFEVAADAMAAALGVRQVVACCSPLDSLDASVEHKLEYWGYSSALVCHILWKLLASGGADDLIQKSMTFEDQSIHPDPIKRRFNIQAFIRIFDDPSTSEGADRNEMVNRCYERGTASEYEATKQTPLIVESDPAETVAFMARQFISEKSGKSASVWQRLISGRATKTLMRDPSDWISHIHSISDRVQPAVAAAEDEFLNSLIPTRP